MVLHLLIRVLRFNNFITFIVFIILPLVLLEFMLDIKQKMIQFYLQIPIRFRFVRCPMVIIITLRSLH